MPTATVLPSFGLTTGVWNMGRVQLIQFLMHIWGLYQALLQKHQCLENETPSKFVGLNGETAPQTNAERMAILEGKNCYLEIENQRLQQEIAKLQEQIAHQQKEISHLQKILKFWVYLAQESAKVARDLLNACCVFMFDPISQDSFLQAPVLCVGVKSARAFVTECNSVSQIEGKKHPLVQNDTFTCRDFPELNQLNRIAGNSKVILDNLQNYHRTQYPKN